MTMRRLWAAGAAISICLALDGGLALAQDSWPSASLSPPETMPAPHGSSRLSLEVADLVGMYGLEVAADLLDESGAWGLSLFAQIVHQDDAVVTASHVLEPGRYSLFVYAGEPPCEVRFVPLCDLDEPGYTSPTFLCMMTFDLEPNEATGLRIAGLPRSEGEAIPACPVSDLLHPELPAPSDG